MRLRAALEVERALRVVSQGELFNVGQQVRYEKNKSGIVGDKPGPRDNADKKTQVNNEKLREREQNVANVNEVCRYVKTTNTH